MYGQDLIEASLNRFYYVPPPLGSILFDDTRTSLNVVNNHSGGDVDSEGQLCRLIDLTGNATQAESSATNLFNPQVYGQDSNEASLDVRNLFRYVPLPLDSIPFEAEDSATNLFNPQVYGQDSSLDVQNRFCYLCRLIDLTGNATQAERTQSSATNLFNPQMYGQDSNDTSQNYFMPLY